MLRLTFSDNIGPPAGHPARRRMDLKLGGKVAIVTGGASGGLLARLRRPGCSEEGVPRHGRRSPRARRECRSRPPGSRHAARYGHGADVSTDDFAEPLASRPRWRPSAASTSWSTTPRPIPRIRGTSTRSPSGTRPSDTNLRSLFPMSKRFTVPRIAARGGGRSSTSARSRSRSGWRTFFLRPSKGGQLSASRALAREVGAQNIRVNNISPGAFSDREARRIHLVRGLLRFVIGSNR
mgnify:CR=1 FL=1